MAEVLEEGFDYRVDENGQIIVDVVTQLTVLSIVAEPKEGLKLGERNLISEAEIIFVVGPDQDC